jgi:cell filamentation protein
MPSPFDPYVYPGTNVLINRFDVRDRDRLDEIEAAYTSLRLSGLAENPLSGEYGCQHLQAMHGQVFRDLYDWAGELRVIDIEKPEAVLGGLSIEYCPHEEIARSFEKIAGEMKAVRWVTLPLEEQAAKFSDYFSCLWQIHPFREGNTRIVTHFCCQYADSVNMPINRKLFQEHSEYLRNALVAARAIFNDLGNRSRPEYLYKIVLDAISFDKSQSLLGGDTLG